MKPVKTFSIGFHENQFNEVEQSRKVAKHLNTEHNDLMVSPKEAMAVIPDLPSVYCEPFSDSSQIPTLIVSKLAKKHILLYLCQEMGVMSYLWL